MSGADRFNRLARVLHWTMAVLILAMLFVGVTMVSSLTLRPGLVDLHRPLGIAILLLACVRLGNRLRSHVPPLPADLPRAQVLAARASHWLLYGMMFAMPLIGWAMLSAGAYPVEMWNGFVLPPIAPHDPATYSLLRSAHRWGALLLFATVLGHLGAALYHAWVRRDGVFRTMAPRRAGPAPVIAASPVDSSQGTLARGTRRT